MHEQVPGGDADQGDGAPSDCKRWDYGEQVIKKQMKREANKTM